ncbi:hypothetical protein [Teichococcus aestuarii]|uniref:hypothetical protein n=1 Tax=Teichococcus aestuarii TaxID=568898 RepID=UPI003618F34B
MTATTKRAASEALAKRISDVLYPRQAELEQHSDELQRNPQKNARSIASIEAEISRVKGEIKAVLQEQELFAAPAAIAKALLRACDDWISQNSAVPRASVSSQRMAPISKGGFGDDLRKARADLEKAQQSIETARAAPVALEEACATLDRLIASAAARQAPSMGSLLRRDGHKSLDELGFQVTVRNMGEAYPSIASLEFLVALFPDAIKAALTRRLEEEAAKVGPGLTEVERRQKIAEAEQQIRAAEVAEEVAIRGLEAQGHEILRRADARPEIVIDGQDQATPAARGGEALHLAFS